MRASDFDFELPEQLIAQRPAAERDQSRLLVLGDSDESPWGHHRFAELPALLEREVSGALIVLNDTRVVPARLRARKLTPDGAPGGQVELLLCEPAAAPGEAPSAASEVRWRAMYRASKPLRDGGRLELLTPDGSPAGLPPVQVVREEGRGYVVVALPLAAPGSAPVPGPAAGAEPGDGSERALHELLGRIGEVPLPPYIERERERTGGPHDAAGLDDCERYQTVYARVSGSVAAPTAGLHFTPALLAELKARGFDSTAVTLHVGPGTFLPLRSDELSEHVMHPERFHIPEETAHKIAAAKAAGRKVLAVGTTVVRTLESATPEGQSAPRPGWGSTRLFIYPPYRFRVVDALLTNFHLPRSTLLMLVAALAGRRRLLAAYAEAVRQGYRFYSYGDAMLIPRRLPDPEFAALPPWQPPPS
ncbi:MAG: tRNA preQ1(34) S-adenosylmethionine ribosyltransferase-isomerase QueA [Polyangia bacterium]